MTTTPNPIREAALEIQKAINVAMRLLPDPSIDGDMQEDMEKIFRAALAPVVGELKEVREACSMTVAQWDEVTQPGAACEDCLDPGHVAACRKSLSTLDRIIKQLEAQDNDAMETP